MIPSAASAFFASLTPPEHHATGILFGALAGTNTAYSTADRARSKARPSRGRGIEAERISSTSSSVQWHASLCVQARRELLSWAAAPVVHLVGGVRESKHERALRSLIAWLEARYPSL